LIPGAGNGEARRGCCVSVWLENGANVAEHIGLDYLPRRFRLLPSIVPMIRSLLTVSTGTLASRLLGFARDAMIAALLGAGPVADAFLAAFQLVNVVRRLLAEGGLNASLVPAWLRVRDTDGAAAAAAFAGRVLGTVTAALFAGTLLLALLMPFVLMALAPGFAGRETLQLAVDDARLMLPYLAFAGPVTVMMALLNAQGRFALTAFSPLLFNVALIAVMFVLLASSTNAVRAAQILAATVGVAGLLQLCILVLRRGSSIATPLRMSFDKEIRGFLAKAVPGMIASSTPQLLMVAGAIIASSSPSSVSWLYFANRLVELPLGIVGVAMGTVLIPEMTRALRGEDRTAVAQAESRGLELAVGLALPATLGLILLSEPVVRLLFEHGAFTATDTAATAQALMWLALGLPANVLVKALSPAFFAREDTVTPLLAMLKGTAFALVLAVLLGHWFGASGVAAAIALGAWSTALTLIRRGAETFGFSIDAAARRRLPGILAAALAMGAALWIAVRWLTPVLTTSSHGLVIVLPILIIAGIAIYGLFLRLFGITGWRETVKAIRQNRAADLRD
jgi:putative peptidoglycan lipid II flippase